MSARQDLGKVVLRGGIHSLARLRLQQPGWEGLCGGGGLGAAVAARVNPVW